jgi:hypothetical protein
LRVLCRRFASPDDGGDRVSWGWANEVRALVDFTKAKNNLDRAVGKTLEVQSIRVEDALSGNLQSPKRIPGTPSQARVTP